MNIKGPYSEETMIRIFAGSGFVWPSRAERWKRLQRTVFMADNPKFLIIYGKKNSPEAGKPIAAQGWARFDGIYLGQGLRNAAGIGRKGYATRIAREVFIKRNKRPAVIFPNVSSKNIYLPFGFRKATIEDVKSLSFKLAQNMLKEIPDCENWKHELMILSKKL